MKKQTGIRLFFAILKIFALVALVFLLYSWGKKAYSFGYQVVAQEAVSRPPGKDVAVTLDNGMTGEELAELLEDKGLRGRKKKEPEVSKTKRPRGRPRKDANQSVGLL